MIRTSIKIVGAQGQGINSVGEMCAKGLKRAGYCVFGYREYMSLIKGGHSSYQLDVSPDKIESTETKVNVLVCFNHHGLEKNLGEVKDSGLVLHQSPEWKFSQELEKDLAKRKIIAVCLPVDRILKELKAPPVLGNVLITAVVWAMLRRDADELKELVREQFGHKGEKILNLNFQAIDAAEAWVAKENLTKRWSSPLPKPGSSWKDYLLLTGSHAMGLGLVHAGCRVYAGYPMTPSSPLLGYIGDIQNETGMVMKQAEDEITAAQMMSGAMMMGTRAITATSGGGFDLMSETVSLNAIIENPSVFVLAQRPGPGTGLPTWTAQGDLLLAIGAAHGEFARLVVSVSDAQDSFDLMPEAFNYAEEFQTPVIVLTDKQIAEAIYTQKPYDLKKAKLRRGELVEDPKELKDLEASDRYEPHTPDGISSRWLPGSSGPAFVSQGDEHSDDGTVDESSENASAQMEKRMRKMEALKNALPEPDYFGPDGKLDLLLVSWGSNKSVILDALRDPAFKGKKIGYMHYTYLWPMKTEKLEKLMKSAKKVALIECNYQGQLGMMLRMAGGPGIEEKILKYDGRPFFYDELITRIKAL